MEQNKINDSINYTKARLIKILFSDKHSGRFYKVTKDQRPSIAPISSHKTPLHARPHTPAPSVITFTPFII